MTLRELLLCELFLLLIPMAAYPIREIFHIGKDRRKGQRSTALVCSAIGYLCGFLWSILTPCSWLVHILFLSYVISNITIKSDKLSKYCRKDSPPLMNTLMSLNGSTQVNSTEINSMPVPPMNTIEAMGKELIRVRDMSEATCDNILRSYI